MQSHQWQASRVWVFIVFSLWLIPGIAAAQPYAMQSDEGYAVTYSPHAVSPYCNMNMGPTGATAWMRGHHHVVVSIQHGSPSYGKLMLGDVIVGADGQTFGPTVDSRIALGNAIGQAEANGQPLVLDIIRQGKSQQVAITLPKLGAYAEHWPHGCPKSAAILDQACRSLLRSQMPDGSQVTDGAMGTFMSGLLFLASDDVKYLDAARRAAYRTTRLDYETLSYNNWPMGYATIFMAEYYLATGDDTVLPKIEELAGKMAAGQMRCGSWGHKSPAGGYGALNQPGITCAIALALAKECGVKIDEKALDKALQFFSRFAATGAVPYGDHRPSRGFDDNGRNATAAILFHLVGRDEQAKAFAAAVSDSYWYREQGHTGGFFSMMWGPIAVNLIEPDKLKKFLDYQQWYYDLIRKWNGEITFLPYREALTRFDDTTYIGIFPRFTTGGLGMVYAIPQRKLRIVGAESSVFAAGSKGKLTKARDLYVERDWQGFDKAMGKLKSNPPNTVEQTRWHKQLIEARAFAKAGIDRTLAEINCNLQDGGAFRALKQFEALKTCFGEDADPRFAKLEERFAENNTAWYVREGEDFYEKLSAIIGVTVKGWVPQGRQAERMLEGIPSAHLPYWQPLSASSQLEAQPWRTMQIDKDAQFPEDWFKPGFDDSDWIQSNGIATRFTAPQQETLPAGPIAARRTFAVDDPAGDALRVRLQTVRNAFTQVYLNGKLIVDVERGQRGGYAVIRLDDRVFALLKKGENVLAVTSTAQGNGGNHLDVSLEINRDGADRSHHQIERIKTIHTADLPDADKSLRVQDTANAYREALRQSFMDMSIKQLRGQMNHIVAYYRGLAADALVAKGIEGVKAGAAGLGDDDWKVRSSAIDVLIDAHRKFTEENDQAGLAFVNAQVPALIKLVGDNHFWVRTLACDALGAIGEPAKDAMDALTKAVADDEEWVRQAALGALKRIGADAAQMHNAALKAAKQDNSSFGITRQALAVVKMEQGDAKTKLKIIAELLGRPAEGGGGAMLSEAIEAGCKLDPEGRVMIPLLIDAVADKTHLSRQRGGPYAKAFELLGGYGKKARRAGSTLKAILADESKAKVHEAAQAALDAIAG